MISKRVAGRKDGKSSAASALRYGEGLTPDRETGEVLDKSHRTRLGNFGIVEDGVYAGRDAAEMARIIELAAIEMQSNCDSNTRVGPDKRLAHFVVSFNQDKPSEAVLRDTEDSMLAAMGLDENHFATFLHNDNGYWHLHIFSSRIKKEKPHKGNDLWHDQINRDKVCREIEIRHGLQRDNGLHRVDEYGHVVEIPRGERIAKRSEKSLGISDTAKKAEIYSGEKSFQTWVNEIRIGDRLKHAKSWRDLHEAAAAYGCEVREKGAGFIICPSGEKGGVQLSKVGLKNLTAKFGAFQLPKPGCQAQPEVAYKPAPTNNKAVNHYSKWREANNAFKPVKTDQINEQRETHKQARNILRARHKYELEKIRSGSKGMERFAAVSIAKMGQAAALAELADKHAWERRALFKQLADRGPGNTFRDYLVKQAAAGDDSALVLAQKYGADEATEVLRKREADRLKIVASATGTERRLGPRLRFTHQVERNGTVIFDLGQGRIVTDSAISKQIQLNSSAATDPEAIATSLRFAQAKFGNSLTLTGSPEFQRLAVETAVREGLSITFKDPELQAYKQRFADSIRPNRQEKKHASRHRKQQGHTPPPHLRNRVLDMSNGDMVLYSERAELLLQSDVPGDMEREKAKQNSVVQQPTGSNLGSGSRDGSISLLDARPRQPTRLEAPTPTAAQPVLNDMPPRPRPTGKEWHFVTATERKLDEIAATKKAKRENRAQEKAAADEEMKADAELAEVQALEAEIQLLPPEPDLESKPEIQKPVKPIPDLADKKDTGKGR